MEFLLNFNNKNIKLFIIFIISLSLLITPALDSNTVSDKDNTFFSSIASWIDISIEENEALFSFRRNKLNSNSKSNPGLIALKEQELKLYYTLSNRIYFAEYLSLYIKNQLQHLATEKSSDSAIDMPEYYITLNPYRNLYLDYGKKNILWGSSMGWKINNIFIENDTLFNDNDLVVKKSISTEYYLNQDISISAVKFTDSNDLATKIHLTNNSIDYDVMFYLEDNRKKLGFNASSTIGDAIELHAEGLLQRGSQAYYPVKLNDTIYSWKQSRNNNSLYLQYIIGGQYTTLH